MHVYICIHHIRIYTHTHICIFVYICKYVNMCLLKYMYINQHDLTDIIKGSNLLTAKTREFESLDYNCIYVYAYVHIHICMYMYIYLHKYIFMNIYVYKSI